MATRVKIREITEKIKKEYKPEKIILFGSYAWGKPRQWSDVDLFIVKKSRKRRIYREYELRKKLFGNNFPPMDLLIYTPAELKKRIDIKDFFIGDILSKGKVLYEK
ncbi:MAG: nucleotidyltransferase domain-containing protein [Parcubacteria group bacterium]|nr:nucleotidyltransferase domain-containing protein [Parcubacteria group bacterium]